jgi:hypothetical protein
LALVGRFLSKLVAIALQALILVYFYAGRNGALSPYGYAFLAAFGVESDQQHRSTCSLS